ncbi:MAG: hypothetical protein EHM18_04000 [Acidobacteria bacterium]|nr:MAG: hypothetical protein EHM18_04000 [Acidobacteriota bacterium]
MHVRPLGLLFFLAFLVPLTVVAEPPQDSPDFLFSKPLGALGFRTGMNFPFANSEVFDLVTDQLTLEKGDFRAFSVGGDVAFSVHPQLDIVGSFEYMRSTTPSEVRDFVDEADLPILQETQLSRMPLTAAVKFYPLPRGRSYGSFAWTPARISPYFGGGGGGLYYRFQQQGEFVDFQDLSIFSEDFRSDGWSPIVFGLGGLEVNLTQRLYIDFQLRYEWAESDLQSDFQGFDPIDLSGLRATGGLFVRFD